MTTLGWSTVRQLCAADTFSLFLNQLPEELDAFEICRYCRKPSNAIDLPTIYTKHFASSFLCIWHRNECVAGICYPKAKIRGYLMLEGIGIY